VDWLPEVFPVFCGSFQGLVGLVLWFQVSNVDCFPEVFPGFGSVGLVFGFQVYNMDCLPEVFPGSLQGLIWFPETALGSLMVHAKFEVCRFNSFAVRQILRSP
jgi:hypothetical protein